jgi:hypothetical protein
MNELFNLYFNTLSYIWVQTPFKKLNPVYEIVN